MVNDEKHPNKISYNNNVYTLHTIFNLIIILVHHV